MKYILWSPIVIFGLLSLRAIAFLVYQCITGAAFGLEETVVGGIGLVCGWIAWVMYTILIRLWKKPER